MGYVEIDPHGAHRFGQAMTQASARADTALHQAVSALTVAELSSDASTMLGALQDRLAALGAGVMAKAELAGQAAAQPVTAPVRGTITYTDNDGVLRGIEVRPGGEYDIPRDHLFRDSRVPYLQPYNLVPPGFNGLNPVIELPDGTRFRVVPRVQDIPHSDASPAGSGPIADAGPGPDDSGEVTGFAFGQDLLSADLSGPPAASADPFDGIEAAPGTSLAQAPAGWLGFLPYAGQVYRFADAGDSFLAGLGDLDDDQYVGAPILGQTRSAGVLQALRQLARDYNAELTIRYTADPEHPEVQPPPVPSLDPLRFEAVHAAIAGASTSDILGLTRSRPESPLKPQINELSGADIFVLETGFNDQARDRRAIGLFREGSEEALLPWPWNAGTEDIDRLIRRVPTATRLVPDLLDATATVVAPGARGIFMAPGWFLSPLDQNDGLIPLPPAGQRPSPFQRIDDEEGPALLRLWQTTVGQLGFDVENSNFRPGKSLEFVVPEFAGHTILGTTPENAGVNGILGWIGDIDPKSLHPNALGQEIYRDAILPRFRAAAEDMIGPAPEPTLSPFESFGSASESFQSFVGRPSSAYVFQNFAADQTETPFDPSVEPGSHTEPRDLPPIASGGLDPAWTSTYGTLDGSDSGAVNWGWQQPGTEVSSWHETGALGTAFDLGGDYSLDDSYADPFESFTSPIDTGDDLWSGLETTQYYDTTSVFDYL